MEIKYELQTNKTFEGAIVDLKDSLEKNNFGVLWELNFKDKLMEKGLDFEHNFKILEVCNPKKAKEVLDIHLEVGYFLPCKMVVYEKENSVYVGMLKPTQLIGISGKDDLIGIAEEVEEELINSINMAVR